MIHEYLSSQVTWTADLHAETFVTIVSTSSQPVYPGEIIGIEYIIGDATDAITMTVNLYDNHSVLIHSKAALAKNTATVESIRGATLTTSIPIIMEGFKIGFDPSAASGTTKITGQVRIYYDDRRP